MDVVNFIFNVFSRLLSNKKVKAIVKKQPKPSSATSAKAQFEFAEVSVKLFSLYPDSIQFEQKLDENNLVRLNSAKLALATFVKIFKRCKKNSSNYDNFLKDIVSFIADVDFTIQSIEQNRPREFKAGLISDLKSSFRDVIKPKCKYLINVLKVKPLNRSSSIYSP